jgi:hypothetical protein
MKQVVRSSPPLLARNETNFPPEARVVAHEDNWRWGQREGFSFREHEGHGYWRGGRRVAW